MKKKILLSLLILAVAGGSFGYYLFNKPHQSIADQDPDYKMESALLISNYEKDETAANQQYLGKVIEVIGTVSEKTIDAKGKINVTLAGPDLAGIGCVFENTKGNQLASISEGQKIKIKGICTGVLMDVVLVDCVLTN